MMNIQRIQLILSKCNLYMKILIFFTLFYSLPAFAYIDPASGSAILATIIGFFAAIIWNIKKIYYKIINLLKKK